MSNHHNRKPEQCEACGTSLHSDYSRTENRCGKCTKQNTLRKIRGKEEAILEHVKKHPLPTKVIHEASKQLTGYTTTASTLRRLHKLADQGKITTRLEHNSRGRTGCRRYWKRP